MARSRPTPTDPRARAHEARAPRRAAALGGLLALCALGALGGCAPDPEPRRPNVLWVVVDTLRADKLSCQGGREGLTPYLDAFAAGAVRFESAHAHAPWTLPSCASMLTGLHPLEHGAGGRLADGTPGSGFRTLADGVDTVVRPFRDRGWDTRAIVNVAFLGETFRVTRDFEALDAVFFDSNVEVRRAETTTDAALAHLDGRDPDGEDPFFLFVHYFDPHAVYDPPQPFRRRFAEARDREDEAFVFGTRADMMALRRGELDLDPPTLRRAEGLYDGEVAYTDAEVGRLLDGLAARGLAEDTIVVLCGDHGEEFLDHGGFEHGHTLYEELTHVPLIVRAPGVAPRVVAEPVRLVDVAPTLCELADVAPLATFAGRSLAPLLEGETGEHPRPVLAHGNMWGPPLTSWIQGGWKVVRGEDGHAALFHLATDPDEQRDRSVDEPERLRALLEELDRAEAGLRALAAGRAAELDDEVRAWLESTGYGGGEPRDGR